MKHPHDIPELDLPEPIRPLAEFWLIYATQGLSEDAKMNICAEVCTHCLEAYERFLLEGGDEDTAATLAILMLGNRWRANRNYRATYMTLREFDVLDGFRTRKKRRLWLSILVSGMLAIVLYADFFATTFDNNDPTFPMIFLYAAYATYDAVGSATARLFRSTDRALVLGQFAVSLLALITCVAVAYAFQPSTMFVVYAELLALASLGEAMRMWRLLRKLSGNCTRMTSH